MSRNLRRLLIACFLAIFGPLGGGDAVAQAPSETKPAPVSSQVPGIDLSSYRVGPEDVLEISVWREDTLKKEVLVRPDGGMSYPLVGEVQAAGKTVHGIREEITKRLERFIPDALVSVAILKVGSQRIYVIGRVNKPGEFPIGRHVDVLQTLSIADSLTPFADSNDIRVMRHEGDRQIVLPFEYSRVVRGQKLEQNIELRGGDVVVVP